MSSLTRSITPASRSLGLAALTLWLIAACGGGAGGDLAGVGSGGTGTYSSGAISGYGSIVVNGVHYEETRAAVRGDDDAGKRAEDLQLGMVVEVDAGDITTDATGRRNAVARAIAIRSEIKGRITDISGNATSGMLTVIDQTVMTDAATVYGTGLPGFTAMASGQIVEIYGFLQSDGRYLATRIEPESSGTTVFKLRGRLGNPGVDSFTIGNALIDASQVRASLAGIAAGQIVRVELSSEKNAQGRWLATRLQSPSQPASSGRDGRRVEVEGFVSEYQSGSSTFKINDLVVDGSMTSLPNGLANGSAVEVKGTLTNGVLVAREVSLEDEEDRAGEFELEGRISALDKTMKTFVIRGTTVDYRSTQRFEDGTEADLVNGVKLEVKGRLDSDGTTVVAERIKFDD